MSAENLDPTKLACYLLIGGGVIFWAGAFTPPWEWWYPITPKAYLELIAEHKATWLWIAASFALGVVLTVFGYSALSSLLSLKGELYWSRMGLIGFAVGSVLWLANITFRATATVSAAEEAATSGMIPGWFVPIRAWSGAMFAIYMVIAYLSLAAFGQSMLQTSFAPSWLSWGFIVFGLSGAVGYIVRIPVFDPPLIIHLPQLVLGIVLLTKH